VAGSFVKTKHDNEVNQMKRYEKEQVRALACVRCCALLHLVPDYGVGTLMLLLGSAVGHQASQGVHRVVRDLLQLGEAGAVEAEDHRQDGRGRPHREGPRPPASRVPRGVAACRSCC
jgi:hypothetical protein